MKQIQAKLQCRSATVKNWEAQQEEKQEETEARETTAMLHVSK